MPTKVISLWRMEFLLGFSLPKIIKMEKNYISLNHINYKNWLSQEKDINVHRCSTYKQIFLQGIFEPSLVVKFITLTKGGLQHVSKTNAKAVTIPNTTVYMNKMLDRNKAGNRERKQLHKEKMNINIWCNKYNYLVLQHLGCIYFIGDLGI